ncbi:hypothetical protein PYCC9005_002330 [Savitreella phatthalungensis]
MDSDAVDGDEVVQTHEDFFGESLLTIFDDVRVQHGEPGGEFTFASASHGNLVVRLAHTQGAKWEDILKFAHQVWNAELDVARRIDRGLLRFRGKRVLELGAGTGLAGVMAGFGGAECVVLSDYPAPEILDALKVNGDRLLGTAECRHTVVGYIWGDDVTPLLTILGEGGRFDAVILADCLWMPDQHASLCKSLRDVLAEDGIVYCVAGFHSGRAKMQAFFTSAVPDAGLRVRSIVEENHRGEQRPWDALRHEEDNIERRRWQVIAEIVHR